MGKPVAGTQLNRPLVDAFGFLRQAAQFVDVRQFAIGFHAHRIQSKRRLVFPDCIRILAGVDIHFAEVHMRGWHLAIQLDRVLAQILSFGQPFGFAGHAELQPVRLAQSRVT